MQKSENHRMNPQNKFTCGCCSDSPEGANSDEVIFQYFGKEFTEYEYVVENLAIRPAPKKLLDLVPVHSTNIKFNSNSSSSGNQSSLNDSIAKQPISGAEGDVCRTPVNALQIRDPKEGFISFKTRPEESKQIGRFAPSPYPEHPLTQRSKPAINYAELRQKIVNKDYRSKTLGNNQVLSDLCQASEASLNINSRKHTKEINNGPVPKDIQDTIDSLRFKKAMPDFHTRTENRTENHVFHIPEVYRLNLKSKNQSSDTFINILESAERKPSLASLNFNTDSMAQTEISKSSRCPKKGKKSLKWKIIINKHR